MAVQTFTSIDQALIRYHNLTETGASAIIIQENKGASFRVVEKQNLSLLDSARIVWNRIVNNDNNTTNVMFSVAAYCSNSKNLDRLGIRKAVIINQAAAKLYQKICKNTKNSMPLLPIAKRINQIVKDRFELVYANRNNPEIKDVLDSIDHQPIDSEGLGNFISWLKETETRLRDNQGLLQQLAGKAQDAWSYFTKDTDALDIEIWGEAPPPELVPDEMNVSFSLEGENTVMNADVSAPIAMAYLPDCIANLANKYFQYSRERVEKKTGRKLATASFESVDGSPDKILNLNLPTRKTFAKMRPTLVQAVDEAMNKPRA